MEHVGISAQATEAWWCRLISIVNAATSLDLNLPCQRQKLGGMAASVHNCLDGIECRLQVKITVERICRHKQHISAPSINTISAGA